MKKPKVYCVGGEPLNVRADKIVTGEYCIPIEGDCVGQIMLKTSAADQFVSLESGVSIFTRMTSVQRINTKNILIELI